MRTNSRIALSMIVRGDEDRATLERCLNSIAKWVDGIFITITTEDKGISEVCRKYGVRYDIQPNKFHRTIVSEEVGWLKEHFGWEPTLKEGDKIFCFDAARNYSMSQISKEFDWIIWLDVDDVITNADKLKEIIYQAENNNPVAESVFLNYIYQSELGDDGKIKNIIIQHWRERLIRNNDSYKWVAPIHETLIEQRPTTKIQTKVSEVIHLSSHERMLEAIKRNMRTLEMSIFDSKASDPRPVYYLGKAQFDLKSVESFSKALRCFNDYLFGTKEHDYNNKSGWAEERSQCFELMSEIYRWDGQYNNSVKACMNALIECEKFPTIYLALALTYVLKKEWERALFWVDLAMKLPKYDTTLVINPKETTLRAYEIFYHANLNMSRLDEAWATATKLLELDPSNPTMIDRYKFTAQLKNEKELTKIVMELANYLKAKGEQHKLQPLLYSIPSDIVNNPFMVDLYKKLTPPRVWEANEVAIYCGPGFTLWSPKLLDNPKGTFMGGSEEAVVYLSKELAKQGWKVTVYGDPGEDAGEYEGVNYQPYFKFNGTDDFNILISWRQPKFADGGYKCKKLYIWCHDLLNPLDFTKERMERIEKVIVLSPFHRTNIPDVPDNKILISSNGVNL